MQIFVSNLKGRSTTYRVESCDQIGEIKKRISAREGIPVNELRLTYEGKNLDEKKNLESYKIRNDSTLHLCLRINGGTELAFIFNSLTSPKIRPFSKSAPKYRICTQGLNIEGKCTNSKCEAYQQLVWAKKGCGKFDLGYESCNSHCPLCDNKLIEATNIGINGGFYDLEGFDSKTEKTMSKTNVKAPKDKLLTFSGGKEYETTWKYLTITVRLE